LKRLVSGIILTLLISSMLVLAFNIQPVKAEGTIYIRADGSVDPSTAPISSNDNVTYTFTNDIYESIVVERDNIIVDGNGCKLQGSGLGIDMLYRTNVAIKNTYITRFSYGIRLYESSKIIISGNTITDIFYYGVWLFDSSYNAILRNNIVNNSAYGIWLQESSTNNFLSGNSLTNNGYGIVLGSFSSNNIVSGNDVTSNDYACIQLANSYNNILFNNTLKSHVKGRGIGILISISNSNIIYHNNFINNTKQVDTENSQNIWDDGHPSGGNYWSDYTGIDANGDGIGDTPYVIDADNQDRYPLMHPWNPLPVHNVNRGLGYATIQEAIDANETLGGHTIFVEAGIYPEHLSVNKTVHLIGEGRGVTIIDGYKVEVTANSVVVSGFAIHGLVKLEADGCTVDNNTIFNAYPYGVWLLNSTNNVISNNVMIANDNYNIMLTESSNNTISQNYIGSIEWEGGIRLVYSGIELYRSSNNTIIQNNVTQCQHAIRMEGVIQPGELQSDSSNNTIIENNIENWGSGISFSHSSNNTILKNNITYSGPWRGVIFARAHALIEESTGVSLYRSFNNLIFKNNIEQNGEGVKLADSSFNNITDNNLAENFYGIILQGSQVNSLIGNNVTHGPIMFEGSNETGRIGYGILISYPYYSNLLRNNSISGYMYNFGMENVYSYYFQDIDASNSVDGKPIYYWVNRQNGEIPSDAGYVAIINSTNIRAEGLNLKNNYQGIFIAYSNNVTICKNNLTENRYGVQLEHSFNNTVSGNNEANNSNGVSLKQSWDNDICENDITNPYGTGISLDQSYENTISHNNIANNTEGISLYYSSDNNTISGNNITSNYDGIWLVASSNNTIYHNNFINNTNHAGFWESLENVWDNGYPSGGNYWSGYIGVDLFTGSYQNIIGSDGIGDTPNPIAENNVDDYPLMTPWIAASPGDINRDGEVDMKDVATAAMAFGSYPGHPRWNPIVDQNEDATIDLKDIALVAKNFGKTYS